MIAATVLAACSPGVNSRPGEDAAAPEARKPTTLRIAFTEDAPQFSQRLGNSIHTLTSVVNAGLGQFDDHGIDHPVLLERLPSQDDGTWVVNPDGTMKTTLHLRKDAKWQDGQPITAADFAFAYTVYLDKDIPVPTAKVEKLISNVNALDDSTLDINWRSLYFQAGYPNESDLAPLPSHLVESLYNSDKQTFINSSFWTGPDYVGAGPYRVTGRELGTSITFTANPYFVISKPKIDTIVVKVIPDKNAIVTQLLSGDVDFAEYADITQQQAVTLNERWKASNQGVVYDAFWQARDLIFQNRDVPNYQPAVRDLRVRQALMHAIDREALASEETDGLSPAADSNYARDDVLWPRVDQAITKYPYDLRRTEQLLNAAGWAKGTDGMFRNTAGQTFDIQIISTPDHPTEPLVIADNWKRAGINAQPVAMPDALKEDNEYRVTFPGAEVDTGGKTGDCTTAPTTDKLPSPQNGWSGDRGSFADPEVDAIVARCNATVNPVEHDNYLVALQAALTAKVARGYLYYRVLPGAARSSVKGITGLGQVGSGSFTFNISDWSVE